MFTLSCIVMPHLALSTMSFICKIHNIAWESIRLLFLLLLLKKVKVQGTGRPKSLSRKEFKFSHKLAGLCWILIFPYRHAMKKQMFIHSKASMNFSDPYLIHPTPHDLFLSIFMTHTGLKEQGFYAV